MGGFSGTLSTVLEKFGKSFLIVGYLPTLLFVVLHQLLLFPLWIGTVLNVFALPAPPSTPAPAGDGALILAGLTTLGLPLVMAILLLSFNGVIIRLYEGRIGFFQRFLFRHFQVQNVKKAQALYRDLLGHKAGYHDALRESSRADSPEKSAKVQSKLDSLALLIEKDHEALEAREPVQALPLRTYRVLPTALGNTFAIMEEYPFDRYGIDAVLFWPRLRPLLDEAAPNQAELLTNQKTVLDMTLNLSLLSGLLALEFLITAIFKADSQRAVFLLFTLIAVAMFWFFYQAAVSAAQSFAYFVTTSFDYYRHLILQKLSISVPPTLVEEQLIWLKLGAFLRRGESFYWPQDRSEDKEK